MTIPAERKRSIHYAREFLRSLLDPKQTPRVPKAIRKEAYWRLRHFPNHFEIDQLAAASPRILDPQEKYDGNN